MRSEFEREAQERLREEIARLQALDGAQREVLAARKRVEEEILNKCCPLCRCAPTRRPLCMIASVSDRNEYRNPASSIFGSFAYTTSLNASSAHAGRSSSTSTAVPRSSATVARARSARGAAKTAARTLTSMPRAAPPSQPMWTACSRTRSRSSGDGGSTARARCGFSSAGWRRRRATRCSARCGERCGRIIRTCCASSGGSDRRRAGRWPPSAFSCSRSA